MNVTPGESQEEKVRTTLVLNPRIHQWARLAMQRQGYDKFNEYIAQLIRHNAAGLGISEQQPEQTNEEALGDSIDQGTDQNDPILEKGRQARANVLADRGKALGKSDCL
jgi:hypothetical protein